MTDAQAPRRAVHPLTVVAAALHLAIAVWPLSASGLLAPLWAIIASYLGWAAGAAVLWQVRARPGLALAVAPATLALWIALLTLGERALGWTP